MALNRDVIGKKIGPVTKRYTWKDVVLYALGVGAGFDELEYVYENRLKVIPSFSIASVFDFLAEVGISSNANLAGILHGEQDILLHSPIPTEGELITEGKITAMYDKGAAKGALVVADATTYHSDGQKLFTNIFTLFCRKDGGFGGDPGPSESVQIPDRAPDFVEHASPPADQPLLYRLSGDVFSLHVDPDFARSAGFTQPIMHGLCTHGYACRAVIKHLFAGQPERMTRFRVRFSRTLYPGIPIATKIWKLEDGRAVFRTVNAQTDETVIDGGIVEWISADAWERRKGRTGIRFDGQAAIVTGAGAGLGRAYALALAERGARVVVNDLGGATDGSGASSSAADAVVAEIRKAGGEAVASYDSVATVEGGQAIVDAAIKAFGRVDILINNAGILRDKSLLKMDPAAWRAVLSVHLDGAFNVTRPAFSRMREQKYGRILLTSSAAGLFGNFGQTNYGAAKLGLIGLMNTLRIEGEKYNIKINTVAPIAGTRLTKGIVPDELFDKLKPEAVAPLALYLCSEGCPTTGAICDAGAGYFDRAAIVTGPGAVVGDGKTPPSPEDVMAKMGQIKSLKDAETFDSATAALGMMLDAFNPATAPAATPAGPATVADVFVRMPGAFLADKAGSAEVTFQFNISGSGGGLWNAVIKGGSCEVAEGTHGSPTTTIIMASEDFLALIGGQLNPMKAYTSGKLKIEGDLMKSQLIEKLFAF